MKHIINILIASQLIFQGFVNGQDYRSDVCTPKGSNVVAWTIDSEYSDPLKSYWDSYYGSAYPNIEILATNGIYSTTKKFNCHSYAWHVSDGGTNRWIGYYQGNTDEYIYWEDGSYIEVTGFVPYPGKVSYASDDHSAITTNQSGWFISKWGNKVLARHQYDDCPYTSSNLKYYKLNFQITGPSLLCNSAGEYSLSNTPGGEITWGQSNNLSRSSSQGANPCSFSPVSDGQGWVSASFTSGCGTSFTLPQKNVWVGAPQIASIDGPTSTPNNNWAYYTPVLESELSSATDYEWILNPINSNSVHDYGYYCDIAFYNPGSYQLLVRAKNVCSDPNFGPYYGTSIYVYETYSMLVSPNPSTTEASISIVLSGFEDASLKSASTETTFDENAEWDIEVYDNMQSLKLKKQKLKGNSTRINTQNWKEGVYMVRVKYNDEIITGKLIVKK